MRNIPVIVRQPSKLGIVSVCLLCLMLVSAFMPATSALAQSATLDITDMRFDETQRSVLLSVTNPLAQPVQIEVFFKDAPNDSTISIPTGWQTASPTPIALSASQNIQWTQSVSASSGTRTRYYIVGRTDVDTDGDSLSDAREMLIHGTDETNPDSDNDGINDGTEVINGTNPKAAGIGIVYVVDGANGNDINDGTTLPKRTIASALLAAVPGDTVVLEAGTYVGKVVVPNGVRLLTRGKVVLL